MPRSMEEVLADLETKFKELGDGVKKTAETALAEAKQNGTLTAETKATADKALAQYNGVSQALADVKAALEGVQSRTLQLAQELAAVQNGRGPQGGTTLGEDIVKSEELKAFAAAGGRGTVKIKIDPTKLRAAITSITGSAGPLIWPQQEREIVEMRRMRLTIRALLARTSTTSNLIQYAKQLARTNNAAVVSDGVTKPESNYTWVAADTPVRTIAHWVLIHRNTMDDIPQLQGIVDSEMRYGLALAEEREILTGDGTGMHLNGLIPQATAYSPEFAVTDEQHIDILRLAMLQVALNEYPTDGIVLNPIDWARIELLKDGENRYLWSSPRGGLAIPSMWGAPIVETQSMEVDEFLVGAFMMAATIYDRMDPEVLVSSEDSDNFRKNLLTMRAEERLALAVKRPDSLVFGDFGLVT